MSSNASDSTSFSSQPLPQTGKPHKFRWLWLTLGFSGLALVSASAGALLAVSMTSVPLLHSKLSAEEAKAFNQTHISTGLDLRLPELTRPVNVLVLGAKVLSSDINAPPAGTTGLSYDPTINSLEGLTDAMVLLRFDPATHRVILLSLPRDTRTQVDGIGVTKLNEANAVGGPALAAKSASDLLGGVGIDRYIRINVLGVQKLIDALGGVKVYVPEDMHYQDDTQHLYINLKQGEQHLNGAQAVQYLRFRYDQFGDIGRVQRQQTFIRALQEQTLKPATLTRLPQILSVIQENIDTNLSLEELLALAGFAAQTDRSKTQMLLLPGDFSTPGQFDASYWLPNKAKISEIVARYFGVTSPDFVSNAADRLPTSARVMLQDSTGQQEAVQKLVSALGSAGYGNVSVDQPWKESLAVTRIIAQEGDIKSAEAIQKVMGFGEVQVESTGNLESDVTIRLGKDALQPRTSGEPILSPSSPEATMAPMPSSLPSAVTPAAATE